MTLRILKWIGKKQEPIPSSGAEILLTGTFYSQNWVEAHVRPFAASQGCARVRVVSTFRMTTMEKVEAVYPPSWLTRALGGPVSRLIVFFILGIRSRPHIVGGFHLLFNGMAAALLARLCGARSLYFCVGGPAEVLGGGINSENRVFGKLLTPARRMERQLIDVVKVFDVVITMGRGAARFFKEREIPGVIQVISGGLDGSRLYPSEGPSTLDLILIGRIAPIKGIELFLHVVRCVKDKLPSVKAAVVGDGPLRSALEKMAVDMNIRENVRFTGFQSDPESWLRRAKIFVLTSETEGLSLALMEAMLCGLPAVASRVGDLDELVDEGVNGFLVKDRDPKAFASRILDLLDNQDRLARFSKAARRSAERYRLESAVKLWEDLISLLNTAETG